MQWPNKSPDVNLIDMLWRDLKSAAHKQMLGDLNEPIHHCKEERAIILHKNVRDWSRQTENDNIKLLLLKMALQAISQECKESCEKRSFLQDCRR